MCCLGTLLNWTAFWCHVGVLNNLFVCFDVTVLMDGHKEREAIMELSKAIAFKADLQLLHLRAAFHECNEDYDGAKRDCRAALSVDPTHSDTLELHKRVQNRQL